MKMIFSNWLPCIFPGFSKYQEQWYSLCFPTITAPISLKFCTFTVLIKSLYHLRAMELCSLKYCWSLEGKRGQWSKYDLRSDAVTFTLNCLGKPMWSCLGTGARMSVYDFLKGDNTEREGAEVTRARIPLLLYVSENHLIHRETAIHYFTSKSRISAWGH